MLGKNAIKADRYGNAQKGCFFRKELPQLEAAISRCKEIYLPLGWTWAEQKKTFTAPNGATLKFRPLERDTDAEKYQGQDYTDLYFEELTNWADPKPINKLRATLRSAAGVPCQFHATCNPGGSGHNWVKAWAIDPAPRGYEILTDEDGNQRVFIPAKLEDNRLLLESDPGYVGRLKQSGSEQLVRAWLDGDWNVVEGAYFDCWSPQMVIEPFALPSDVTRFGSFDWGSAAPFSYGWWAILSDDIRHMGQTLPRGAMVRYREWYGAKSPNVGLKMTAEQVGDGIRDRTDEAMNYMVADPAIFAEDGGPSIAERMKLPFHRADNKRVARHGQAGGWDQMRARMIGTRTFNEDGSLNNDGVPMIYCFSTCTDSIRTIPVLQHDPLKAEDVDTSQEDHCGDEWRYACMSRPWAQVSHLPTRHKDRWADAFDDQDEYNWKIA
jgi:hypothetical protein